MGFLDSLFTSKKGSTENTTSTQEGTSNTQSNLWDQIQPFFQQYSNQYSNFDGADTPINAWQTGAAEGQSGVAGSLTGAGNTAAGIANNGISPENIQRFMDPYISSVVDPTLRAQEIQNKQAISSMRGNQAVQGALGNNTGSEAAYYAGVQPGQQAQIASLYSTGYNQAGQLATQDVNARLQGVQGQTQVAGAQTGANVAGGQLGQNVWDSTYKNNLTPYEIANQGVTGLGNLGGLAGATTNTSGKATGTSTGTQTATPSTGGIIAGLAGTALSAFSDERIKENIKPIGETFDGQPIYKYNMKGDPKTQIGLMAQDVEETNPDAVTSLHGIKMVNYDKATKGAEGKASGGEISPLPSSVDKDGNGIADSLEGKVGRYFNLFTGLRKKANGGAIEPLHGMAGGGDVGLGSWMPTVTMGDSAPAGPSKIQKFGSGLSDMSKGLEDNSRPMESGLGEQQQALSSLLGSMGHAAGGEVEEDIPSVSSLYGDPYEAPVEEFDPAKVPEVQALQENPTGQPQAQPQQRSFWDNSSPGAGVWEGDKMSGLQRLGVALTQVHDSPFAGYGKALQGFEEGRMGQEQIDEAKRHNRMAEVASLAKGTKATALEQQLMAAGLKPGTPEFAAAIMSHLNKAATEINMKEESSYDKEIGGLLAKEFIESQTAAAGAQSALASLEVMKTALDDPNLYTGTGGEAIQAIKRGAQTLFNADVKGVAAGEMAQSLGNEIAVGNRAKLPGPMSDADRKFLVDMGPTLSKSPEGNRLIIELGMAHKRYEIAKAHAASEYAAQHGGRLDAGYYPYLKEIQDAATSEFSTFLERMKSMGVQPPRSPTVGTPMGDDWLGVLDNKLGIPQAAPAP